MDDDRESVLVSVQEEGMALEFADENYRVDKTIVLETIKTTSASLHYVDESLKNDPDVIKAAN